MTDDPAPVTRPRRIQPPLLPPDATPERVARAIFAAVDPPDPAKQQGGRRERKVPLARNQNHSP